MTTTNMAPVIGLLPRPSQTYGLFDVAQQLPLDEDAARRWPMHGIKWQPRPNRDAYRADSDCAPADGTSDRPGCEAWVEQLPFKVYDVLRWATAEDRTGTSEQLLAERAETMASYLFSLELLDGTGSGSSVSLKAKATAPTDLAFGQAAVQVPRAVAILENELATRLKGTVGTIYMAPGLFTQAVDACSLERIDGVWRTPNGHAVVADAGFYNAVKPDAVGAGASSATEDWMYASGPLFYRSTDPEFIGAKPDATLYSRNKIDRFIESYGLLVFDAAPVTAVLAAYNTSA